MPDGCITNTPEIDLAINGQPRALSASLILDPSIYNRATVTLDGVKVKGPLDMPSGGSLPSTPEDGAEVYYKVSDGVWWHLRYDASSSQANKWVYLGGPSLTANRSQEGTANGASNTWVTLATTDQEGPLVTVPLAGWYHIAFGASIYSQSLGTGVSVGVSIGGSSNPSDPLIADGGMAGAYESVSGEGDAQVNSGQSLYVRYRIAASSTSGSPDHFKRRWIRVSPIRLG